jgi:hypothetical protein
MYIDYSTCDSVQLIVPTFSSFNAKRTPYWTPSWNLHKQCKLSVQILLEHHWFTNLILS